MPVVVEILVEVEEYLVDADNKGMVADSSSGVSPAFLDHERNKTC